MRRRDDLSRRPLDVLTSEMLSPLAAVEHTAVPITKGFVGAAISYPRVTTVEQEAVELRCMRLIP